VWDDHKEHVMEKEIEVNIFNLPQRKELDKHARTVVTFISNDCLHKQTDMSADSLDERGRTLLRIYKREFRCMRNDPDVVETVAWALCRHRKSLEGLTRETFHQRYFVDIPQGILEEQHRQAMQVLQAQLQQQNAELRQRWAQEWCETAGTPGTQRAISLSLRFSILKRDNYRCRLCGAAARDGDHIRLEVDHITARDNGGTHDPSNLWVLCFECNRGKGTYDL
jgi:5-methylcytosine-specific restriction endonuclease McrA